MRRSDCIFNEDEWDTLYVKIAKILDEVHISWEQMGVNFKKEDPSLGKLRNIKAYLDANY